MVKKPTIRYELAELFEREAELPQGYAQACADAILKSPKFKVTRRVRKARRKCQWCGVFTNDAIHLAHCFGLNYPRRPNGRS